MLLYSGFFGGVLLGLLLYLMMVFQSNISSSVAMVIGILLSPVIGLGLAFSMHVRCVILLMFPQLFSSKLHCWPFVCLGLSARKLIISETLIQTSSIHIVKLPKTGIAFPLQTKYTVSNNYGSAKVALCTRQRCTFRKI